jgi:formiminotetrahydrofolate cyclodeaminase
MPEPISGRTLETLAEELATATEGSGGGIVAASTAALASALVILVARASHQDWGEAPAAATGAETLRDRAFELADTEAAAFSAALSALRPAPEGEPPDLGPALAAAADAPLQIAGLAAEIAALAREAARRGTDDRRPDAAAAALLAEGAARAAAHLVEVNLAVTPGDARAAEAARAATAAGESARAAQQGR